MHSLHSLHTTANITVMPYDFKMTFKTPKLLLPLLQPTMPLNSVSALTPQQYLQKILTARVYDVAIKTDLQFAPILSERLQHNILLKREDQQLVRSFKLRGAANKMAQMALTQPKILTKGVICASAGNHAQGVALSAARLKVRAVVVMPATTPQVKVDAVRHFGQQHAEVLLHGESYSDAYAHALLVQEQQGLTFVHPFDDPDVIAGQGTVGLEMLQQMQELERQHHIAPLTAVFVAIGGGGLMGGIANCIKAISPNIQVYGVQMNDSSAMVQSVLQNQRVILPDVGLFSDGTAVKQVGAETFRIASTAYGTSDALVDGFYTVDTDAVCAAIKDIYIETRVVVEPAGALGIAAIKQHCAKLHQNQQTSTDSGQAIKAQTFAAILCGANMNFDRLRFVAERAEVGEEKEALFAISLPEERGSFRRFCNTLEGRNITEFNYRMGANANAPPIAMAHVFAGISTPSNTTKVASQPPSVQIANMLIHNGFPTLDLTHNDLARDHIRHMVGGRCHAENEHLLRFEFPERPGALLRFLSAMQPEWNISLFHYRNQGADVGSILVGIQAPPQDDDAFARFLGQLGYPYTNETQNPVYRLFLRD